MWALWWVAAYLLFSGVLGVFLSHRDTEPRKATPGTTTFRVLWNVVLLVVPSVIAIGQLVHM